FLGLLQRNNRIRITMNQQERDGNSLDLSRRRKLFGFPLQFLWRAIFYAARKKEIAYHLKLGRFAVPIQKISGRKENSRSLDLCAEAHRRGSFTFGFIRRNRNQCCQV